MRFNVLMVICDWLYVPPVTLCAVRLVVVALSRLAHTPMSLVSEHLQLRSSDGHSFGYRQPYPRAEYPEAEYEQQVQHKEQFDKTRIRYESARGRQYRKGD